VRSRSLLLSLGLTGAVCVACSLNTVGSGTLTVVDAGEDVFVPGPQPGIQDGGRKDVQVVPEDTGAPDVEVDAPIEPDFANGILAKDVDAVTSSAVTVSGSVVLDSDSCTSVPVNLMPCVSAGPFAMFVASSLVFDDTAVVRLVGAKPVAIVSKGTLKIMAQATIDLSGPGLAAPAGSVAAGAGQDAQGDPNANDPNGAAGGGGGGGNGTPGAAGGAGSAGQAAGAGGAASAAGAVQGGRAGGKGGFTGVTCGLGGRGGGHLQLSARKELAIEGLIEAGGAGGAAGCQKGGGGGGGAGGTIVLDGLAGTTVAGSARLSARGGGGGGGGRCVSGGSCNTPASDGESGVAAGANPGVGGAGGGGSTSAGGTGGTGSTAPQAASGDTRAGGGGGAVGRIYIRSSSVNQIAAASLNPASQALP
jgi:hypothetical protein